MTVEAVPTLINERWTLNLPEHRGARPEWPVWEKERLASMYDNLRPGMRIFDVGTEEGDLSALYAIWGCRPVLFEPNPRVWPNIRFIWDHNGLPMPEGVFVGFVGRSARTPVGPEAMPGAGWFHGIWPSYAYEDVIGNHAFLQLNERPDVPTTTIDRAASKLGQPDAITMDVEGSELEVVTGALATLRDYRPLMWISVHPSFMEIQYDAYPEDLWALLDALRYEHHLLAVDHEHHYFCYPRERSSEVVL